MNIRLPYTALRLTLVLTLVTGVAFPLVLYGLAQGVFPRRAATSLVHDRCNNVVGSRLVGQQFTSAWWFHARPSAADYNAVSSGGSNLGPLNVALTDSLAKRAAHYRAENGLPANAQIPIDAITASASGLDPDISVQNALLQAARVARALQAKGATADTLRLRTLIEQHSQSSWNGELRRVNVLMLNLAVDSLYFVRSCEATP